MLTSRRDLRSASGGRLEAAEDAGEQAAGAGRPAGGRGLARARGARAQRAARPRPQGRRDLRDRPAAAARRRRRWHGCAPRPRAGSARRRRRRCLASSTRRSPCPRSSCRSCRACRRSQEGSSAAAELLKVLLRLVAEKEGVAAKVLASERRHRPAGDRRRGQPTCRPCTAGGARCSASRRQAGARRDRAQIRERRKIACSRCRRDGGGLRSAVSAFARPPTTRRRCALLQA